MTAGAPGRIDAAAPVFRDPNEMALQDLSIRLLREILEYQQRLTRLLAQEDGAHGHPVNAYRKAIRVRREMLRDLPLAEHRHADDDTARA